MLGNLSGTNSIPPMTLVSCSCPHPKTSTKNLTTKISINNSTNSLSDLSLVNKALLFFIGIYRTIGTTFLGGACRFEPSCSEYAAEAFRKHDALYALKLTSLRLLKCHPWGAQGYDPVPEGKIIHE